MKMNIHIDRLVLDGLSVPYHLQPELQGAVETELARLFTDKVPANDLFTDGGAVSCVVGNKIPGVDESNAAHLGQQIARAVYEGVKQ
jgi:hypothetical protein